MFCSLVFLFASCQVEDEGTDTGGMTLQLTSDFSITSITKSGGETKSAGPSVNDFRVEIYQNEGQTLYRGWESFADMGSTVYLPQNAYLLKAVYGQQHKGAFEKPYYEGSAAFTITRNQNTNVSVVCRVANVKVTVDYKEGFKNYFKDYSIKMASTGDSLVFAKDETRAAFFEPGRIGMRLLLTKQDGSEVSFVPPAIQNTEGGKHYQLSIDVTDGGAGGVNLAISFDKTTEEKPILINLDASQMETTPFFTPIGFTSGQPVSFIEGTDFETGALYTLLTARKGIQSCVIRTDSRELQKLGWPAQVDLAAAGADLSALTALGFSYTAGDQMAELDFSKVASRLPSNASAPVLYTFYLEATDKSGQRSGDFSLQLESLMPGFELFQPEDIKAGTGETTLTFELTEGEASKVMPQYLAYGQWYDCEFVEPIAPTGTQNVYTCKVKMATVIDQVQLRLSYNNGSRVSNQVTQKALPLAFTVEVSAEYCWATQAYLTIKSDVAGLDLSKFKVQENGASGYLNTSVESNMIVVKGLHSGQVHNLTVTLGSAQTNCTLTTEAEEQLLNADFEGSQTEVFNATINKGGKYGSKISSKQSTQDLKVYNPSEWCTVNAKTVPSYRGIKNTWYMVPSALIAEESGNHLVCLQNVKWSDNYEQEPEAKYGNIISPSSLGDLPTPPLNRKSAGKLFLGSYAAPTQAGTDNTDMDETYTYGIPFTSRPLSLQFTYKYDSSIDGDDNGIVKIEVLDKNNLVIGRSGYSYTALAESDYTTLTLPITYTYKNKQAAKIRLFFASSKYASDKQSKEDTSEMKTKDRNGDAVSTGNQLFIDNIELLYE